MAAALPFLKVAALVVSVLGTGAGLYQQKRASDRAKGAQASQARAIKSLAPPPPTGPTAAEIQAQKLAKEATIAKAAAEKRTSDLEAGIKADTASAVARKKSIIGSGSTIKTSAFGLKGRAPTEKKTLLGQGGLA